MQDLTMSALKTFVEVVKRESFTAAGQTLGRSQSSISAKIQNLESDLGVTLLDRTSRSLSLTDEGRTLLAYALRMIDLNAEALAALRARDQSQSVRLGVVEYFVPDRLPKILNEFRRKWPSINVLVSAGLTAELLDAQSRGDYDLVIGKCGDLTASKNEKFLRSEDLCWIAADTFVPRRGDPVPLCAAPPPCLFRTLAVESLERVGCRWELAYTSRSIASIVQAVRAGLGLTVACASCITDGVRRIEESERLPTLGSVSFALHYGPGKPSRQAQLLGGHVRDAFAAQAEPA